MSKRFEKNVIRFLELLHYSEEIGRTGKFAKKYFKRKSEYEHLVNYLERKGLIIKINYEGTRIFQLTDRGIEFLLERKREKRQEEFNKIIALTGCILALVGIYTFLKELNLISAMPWIIYVFVFFVVVSLGPIIAFLWKIYATQN